MSDVDPATVAAVRAAARRLARLRPGQVVELRVPGCVAVQLGTDSGGPTHRRGTPGSVVEMDGSTFLALLSGELSWTDALTTHKVSAHGAHADLSGLFPQPSDS